MRHFGDIMKLKGSELPIVDVITGGSPCQDLSVAGRRAGLAGERSGLFMEQIRLIKEMRDECIRQLSMRGADVNRGCIRPRYMVWENVPGAFSSNGGEDFRAVLEETAKVADEDAVIPGLEGRWTPCGAIVGDGWSVAWRVHDAQYWGVPQRRKRICLLADFNGDSAGKILFELRREAAGRDSEPAVADSGTGSRSEVQPVAEGLSGNTAESRAAGQGSAGNARNGAPASGGAISFQERAGKPGGGKGILIQNERTGALSTLNNQSVCAFTTEMTPKTDENGIGFSLRSRDFKDPQAVVYGISPYDSGGMKSANPHAGIYEAETSRSLDLNGGNPACNQGGMMVVEAAGVDGYNQTMDIEVAQPLRAAEGGDSTPKVVCLEGNGARESHRENGFVEGEVMYTLNTVEQHAVAYRGDAITNPINASNPKLGDPCHTLVDDGRNYVVLENHPADSRVKVSEDGVVQTLSGRMGTGGGNVPMVMGQGTYQETMGALCTSGYNKLGTQEAANDMYVVQSMEVFHCTSEAEKTQTLKARDYKDPQVVAYGLDRASFNQGQNAQFDFSVEEEKVGALTARGPGRWFAVRICRLPKREGDRRERYVGCQCTKEP